MTNYRDAESGEYVTEEFAEENPSTTVGEAQAGPPTPSVGRVVHYVSYGTPGGEYQSRCRAAVITEVETADVVCLAVLNPTGVFFDTGLTRDDGERPAGGTWHWPERV